MNMYELIVKKKRGGELAKGEIDWMIREYTAGRIPDYQMSAMMMAVCFVGMSAEETKDLTLAMAHSGDMLDLSAIRGIKIDKHSTGGVGDKTTLVLAPLVASLGVPVAKMSGRGLGHTGGTIDKLESFTGFHTDLTPEQFIRNVNTIHIAVAGQTANLAPADKKLYALRDVTGTVDQMSLIASSIMSKKLAAGSDAILLDVKCGNGAFMESESDAVKLAELMCGIGEAAGKKTVAAVTDMSQPLGHGVGNAIEVIEAIETLKGNGPEDITELTMRLAGIMIYLGGRAKTADEGKVMAAHAVKSGMALAKFRKFVAAQGGNPDVTDDYSLFPQAKEKKNLTAQTGGYVSAITARSIGLASQHTGAGRATKEDSVDLSAGVILHKKVGDKVSKGDVLATFYGNDKKKVAAAEAEAASAFVITGEKVNKPALIKEVIGL